MMKCSVFIATSADGFIARKDGNVDWLHSSGKHDVDMGPDADMGFIEFMASVDCLIMGRNTMEMISAMHLTDEQWPYGDTKIFVLSQSLQQLPDNMTTRAELVSEDIQSLMARCESLGFEHAYIDGGKTIQSFLALGLVSRMTITQVPVLLGQGIPLFSGFEQDIVLSNPNVRVFPNDYVQFAYELSQPVQPLA